MSHSPPISRRGFLSATAHSLALAALPSTLRGYTADAYANELVVEDPDGVLGRTNAPVVVVTALEPRLRRAAEEGRLLLGGRSEEAPDLNQTIPVQSLGPGPDDTLRLCWLMPNGPAGRRTFVATESPERAATAMRAARHEPDGQFEATDSGKPVLRYNYAKVEPDEAFLQSVSQDNRKYAVARSNYIHPLYGPHGEVLTKDWSRDHPHHRGIYWAWPEVDWRGQRGDLHALQKVFARPTGKCETTSGPVFAQIDAENLWLWEDRTPMVRERALIRAYRATPAGRVLDLGFLFRALDEPVLIARRGAAHYGGLNLRFSAVANQQLTKHTDPAAVNPRMAWSDLSGTSAGSREPAGVAVFQNASNPDYPGDWVEYPELNWLQPTFPAAGTRYELRKDKPLALRFRLWIHSGGALPDPAGADLWQAAQLLSVAADVSRR